MTFRERHHQPLLSWPICNSIGNTAEFFRALGYPLANFFLSFEIPMLWFSHSNPSSTSFAVTFFDIFLFLLSSFSSLFLWSQSSFTVVDHCHHEFLLVWIYILSQSTTLWQKTAHIFSTCVEFYLFMEFFVDCITHLPGCLQLDNAGHLLHTCYHW